jgi:hypothetical protein
VRLAAKKNVSALLFADESLLRSNPALARTAFGVQKQMGGLKKNLNFGMKKVEDKSARAAHDRLVVMCLPSVQDDDEFMDEACRRNGLSLQWASKRLRNDKKIVLAACRSNPLALRHALLIDKEVVMTAFTGTCPDHQALAECVPEEFLQDEEVMYTMVSNDWRLLKYVPQGKWSEKLIQCGLEQSGMALSYAPKKYRENKELVIKAVTNDFRVLTKIPAWLRYDDNVLCAALRSSPEAMVFANEQAEEAAIEHAKSTPFDKKRAKPKGAEFSRDGIVTKVKSIPRIGLQGDSAFASLAVGIDGKALEHISTDLQANRDVVMKAVAKDGLALQSASPDLQDDKGVVKKAIEQNPASIRYASLRLREKPEIIQYVVERDPVLVQHAGPSLKKIPEFAKQIVAREGRALQYFADDVRSTKEVAAVAVGQNPRSLQYVGPGLLKDKSLVMRAVAQNGDCQAFLGPEVAEESFVVAASRRVREADAVQKGRTELARKLNPRDEEKSPRNRPNLRDEDKSPRNRPGDASV